MRIVVYGAGGVGGFWGGLLARAGHDVRFVARGAHLAALVSTGLRIESATLGTVFVSPVSASGQLGDAAPADLILVAVKAHQMAAILDDLGAAVGPSTVLLALQNGVDADDVLRARWGDGRVLSAVVYVGASLAAPGVIRHAARGLLLLGNPYGVAEPAFQRILAALSAPGLEVRSATDIHRDRWYKLMWNASFNAVSALTLQTSGPLVAQPAVRRVIRQAMVEVAAVARACGVALTDADVDRSLAETERMPPIRTSMLEDREHGRPMEIDALLGAVSRRGVAHGVPTPVIDALEGLLLGVRPGLPAAPVSS